MRAAAAAVLVAICLAGCSPSGEEGGDAGGAATRPSGSAASSDPSADAQGATGERFPDVLEATLVRGSDGFDVAATISSPYDTPERYADAFRVRGEDGTVYGVRELTHDHASEQPFTRSLTGVEVPDGVRTVVVEGRDMVDGWGGESVSVAVPTS